MIDPAKEIRYVVRVEAQAVLDPLPNDELDVDRDELLEIDEMLQSLDLDDEDSLLDETPQQLRFDLCSDCYRRFMQDPLGVESALIVGFSSN
jgi:hypothetical protein